MTLSDFFWFIYRLSCVAQNNTIAGRLENEEYKNNSAFILIKGVKIPVLLLVNERPDVCEDTNCVVTLPDWKRKIYPVLIEILVKTHNPREKSGVFIRHWILETGCFSSFPPISDHVFQFLMLPIQIKPQEINVDILYKFFILNGVNGLYSYIIPY